MRKTNIIMYTYLHVNIKIVTLPRQINAKLFFLAIQTKNITYNIIIGLAKTGYKLYV